MDYWFQHVDDVSCLLVSPAELIRVVARELVPLFIRSSEAQLLVVSPKTAVVGSTSDLTNMGVELLRENGVKVDLKDMDKVQDIGIERAPRRSLKVFGDRWRKTSLGPEKARC